MSALETAKEIGRMASATTLGKDVIDLLKEKVTLLKEQITTLETENTELKKQVANLNQELDRIRPKGDMAPEAVRLLKLLFDQGRALTITQIAGALGMSKGIAEYHRDNLVNAKPPMIRYPMVVTVGAGEPPLSLATAGRAYLVEHGHVS